MAFRVVYCPPPHSLSAGSTGRAVYQEESPTLPEVQNAHPEERRVQPHDVPGLSLYVYPRSHVPLLLVYAHSQWGDNANAVLDQFCWICMGEFQGYDHFSTGKCKGLQNWSSHWTKYGAYAGIGVGVAAGVVVVTPIVIGAPTPLLHSSHPPGLLFTPTPLPQAWASQRWPSVSRSTAPTSWPPNFKRRLGWTMT